MKSLLKQIVSGAMLLVLPLMLTGCEDILGKWERPTPSIPTPTPTSPFDALSTPLTLEAVEDGQIKVSYNWGVTLSQPIKYAINGEVQEDITAATSTVIDANHLETIITVKAGDMVQFWSNNSALGENTSKHLNIKPTAKCYIYGNFMSLIDDGTEGFVNDKTIGGDWAFSNLFYEADKIYNHPEKEFVLPATTLSKGCYFSLFALCPNITRIQEDLLPAGKDGIGSLAEQCYRQMFIYSGITSIPEKLLPATILMKECYQGMFGDCYSITSIPEKLLPAGKGGIGALAENCYHTMFNSSIGLTSIPVNLLPATSLKKGCYSHMFIYSGVQTLHAGMLPATELADECYSQMFRYSKLVDVPYSLLPATTLTKSCYNQMFANCEELLTSPKLGASTLVSGCYGSMFFECKKLGSVTCLATSGFDQSGLNSWLEGAGSSAGSRTLHVKTSDTHDATSDWKLPSTPAWTLTKDQP